jgi:nucleotidyltransferase/DNA polymerase involved in DNA repair
MPVQERSLQDLISVGPAMLRDFEMLGIRSVKQLARQDPVKLYRKLCRITGQHVDICCQDVFSAAVAQARNPLLPVEQCQWWYWSRQRKASHAGS